MKKHVPDIVKRYEDAVNNGSGIYFDISEIEQITRYFDDNGELESAINAVEYGLMLHPSDFTLLLIKVSFMLEFGDVEVAEKILNSLSVDNIDTRLLRIEIYLNRSDFSSAERELDYILLNFRIEDEDIIAILDVFFNFTRIEFIFYKLRDVSIHIKQPKKFLLECVYYTDEDLLYSRSIAIYNTLLDSDPYNIDYWLCLTAIYIKNKDYIKAIESCEYIFAINDDNYKGHLLCGKAHYLLGEYKKAIEHLTHSYLLDNTQQETAQLLSNSLWKIENYSLSIHLVSLLEKDSVILLTAKVKHLIVKNQLDEALQLLADSLKSNKDKFIELQESYILLFDVLYLKGEYISADTVLQKYIDNWSHKYISEYNYESEYICKNSEYLIRLFFVELYFGRVQYLKDTLNELDKSSVFSHDYLRSRYNGLVCNVLGCSSLSGDIDCLNVKEYNMTAFNNFFKDASYVPFRDYEDC